MSTNLCSISLTYAIWRHGLVGYCACLIYRRYPGDSFFFYFYWQFIVSQSRVFLLAKAGMWRRGLVLSSKQEIPGSNPGGA